MEVREGPRGADGLREEMLCRRRWLRGLDCGEEEVGRRLSMQPAGREGGRKDVNAGLKAAYWSERFGGIK